MGRVQEFDFSVDLMQAILWQYNDASRLQSLLQQKQSWYDENQTKFWQDWYRDVFDLRTANDFGLAVWAIILNVPLYVVLPAEPSEKKTFGFGHTDSFGNDFGDDFELQGDPVHTNFFHATFAPNKSGIQGLTQAQRRIILRLRYFNLTMRPSVPQINAFLKQLFKDEGGDFYVVDNLDMSARYIFTYTPTAALQYVLENFDILPRPAGVKISVNVVTRKVFGFGPNNANFYNSNFGA